MTALYRYSISLVAVASMGTMFGCANYEVNSNRGNIPGHLIRYEMQEADRAVEAARQAGKDKLCPAEFKAAEDAKDKAYDVYRACHTEEGSALAKQATAKANDLCPPQAVKPVAAPPVPAPAPAPAPAPKPAPPVPTDRLTITPDSITKGQAATLTWTSRDAEKCDINPGFSQVQPQGSLVVRPSASGTYTLTCVGEGGTAKSSADITVTEPAPVAAPAPVPVPVPVVVPAVPKAAVAKLCTQTVIDIHFDTQKAVIKPQYHDELKKLADFLKEFPDAKGAIEGHTDSDGSMASNMDLSQRRADSVRDYLVKNFGIAPGRISAKGFGPTKPVADNKSKAGKQKNRRIETNFSCDGK